ncbi:hypothetical protein HIM_01032 [Hirsutella minnesotensis 3608]|nr:hypothetical protein HIM_01032 [Hirsutella minnesotensis 3608]
MEEARSTLGRFSSAQEDPSSLKHYDAAIRQYIQALGKLSSNARRAILADPVAILKPLDPHLNSIGYVTVLDSVIENPEVPPKVLDLVVDFLLRFDPCQVRYVGTAFTSLLEKIGSGKVFSQSVAVGLMVSAMLRLDPSGSMFTSTHLTLAKLAYTSAELDSALPVLDADILFYPAICSHRETKQFLCDPDLPPSGFISPTTGLTDQLKHSMVLEYNLIRGLVYISKRDWAKASAALEQIITHPARSKGVSKFMTEAHKKWILVGLLKEGKTPRLPSYTSASASASYQVTSEAYITFANLFNTDDVAQLRTEFDTNRQVWEDDGNTSLMNEVMAAYQKWQIISLRHVYRRVSISQVRHVTLSAETGETLEDDEAILALIQSMIASEMLHGELQRGDGDGDCYLAFGEASSPMTEGDFAREVARSHQSIQSLTAYYRVTNDRLSGHKDYVRHVMREQKRMDMEKEADAAVGFETQVEDEDLMTGVMAHA